MTTLEDRAEDLRKAWGDFQECVKMHEGFVKIELLDKTSNPIIERTIEAKHAGLRVTVQL